MKQSLHGKITLNLFIENYAQLWWYVKISLGVYDIHIYIKQSLKLTDVVHFMWQNISCVLLCKKLVFYDKIVQFFTILNQQHRLSYISAMSCCSLTTCSATTKYKRTSIIKALKALMFFFRSSSECIKHEVITVYLHRCPAE